MTVTFACRKTLANTAEESLFLPAVKMNERESFCSLRGYVPVKPIALMRWFVMPVFVLCVMI